MGNVKINQVYKGGTHLLGLVKFDHFRLTKKPVYFGSGLN